MQFLNSETIDFPKAGGLSILKLHTVSQGKWSLNTVSQHSETTFKVHLPLRVIKFPNPVPGQPTKLGLALQTFYALSESLPSCVKKIL